MELILLDKDFQVSGLIEKFTSLQWNRRYYDAGDFEAHIASEYFPLLEDSRYLYNGSADETAIIESIMFSRPQNNQTDLILRGRFLEALLFNRVVPQTANLTGNLETAVRGLVETCAMTNDRAIPLLELDTANGFPETVSMQVTGDNLMDKLYSLLRDYGLSYRIRYDYLENRLLFGLWRGKDRTQDQTENSFAIFSDDFENIMETAYSYNRMEYKNFAYVAGAGEGADRIVEEVDRVGDGEDRRELYVDARDLSPEKEDGTAMTDSEYRAILRQRGVEKLAEFPAIEAIDGKADLNANLEYRVDFDLGDICDYANPGIGLSVQKRLTEVREIYEGVQMRLDTVFGEDYIRNVRQLIKREVT